VPEHRQQNPGNVGWSGWSLIGTAIPVAGIEPCRGSPRDPCDTAAVASGAPRSHHMVSNVCTTAYHAGMYDPQAREQAKTLYAQRGAAYAAEQTGIPERTIRRWALTEGWQHRMTVVAAQDARTNAAASQAAILGWQTRRRHMADQLGHVGAQLLEAIQRELAERKRLNLRDAGILLGIMLDKAELLAAQTGATGYGELSPEQSLARIDTLLDVLEDRAEAGHGG
jgi:hypothetical protein